MVKTKRNQEKVVVTKICFYVSAKIEQKIKVCVIENKGSVAKMIQMKIVEGINIITTQVYILLGSLYIIHVSKMYMCTCVHLHIYMYI